MATTATPSTSTSASTNSPKPPKTKPAQISPSQPQLQSRGPITVPRITITFCTQCKWNLRAAYFAQELLQTFGTALGEVALVPGTGGVFVIELFHRKAPGATAREGGGVDEAGNALGPGAAADSAVVGAAERAGDGTGREDPRAGEGGVGDVEVEVQRTVVWDRKIDGGFPETKVLKGRVRDLVQPQRGLGHTDRALRKDGEKRDGEGQGQGQGQGETKPGEGRDAEGNAEVITDEGTKGKDCEDCR